MVMPKGHHHTELGKQHISEGNIRRNAIKFPKIELICSVCNKHFFVSSYYAKIRKYCSKSCGGKTKIGERNPFYGKSLSEDHRRKIHDARIKTIIKICPTCGNSFSNKGYSRKIYCSDDCGRSAIKKSNSRRCGKNSALWKGGISYEPYCPRFTKEFKERVRAFFGYQCIECGTPQNGELLHVHHVNYNKQSCCDNTIPLFVPLCRGCHTKTTHSKRKDWENHFTDIINQYYGGKCYFTKDEYNSFIN
jgi:hypothetical protein